MWSYLYIIFLILWFIVFWFYSYGVCLSIQWVWISVSKHGCARNMFISLELNLVSIWGSHSIRTTEIWSKAIWGFPIPLPGMFTESLKIASHSLPGTSLHLVVHLGVHLGHIRKEGMQSLAYWRVLQLGHVGMGFWLGILLYQSPHHLWWTCILVWEYLFLFPIQNVCLCSA